MNDVYMSTTLSYRDRNNKLKQDIKSTDTHWRAKGGKGSFNYRLIYRDLELPMATHGAGTSDFPRFRIQAFDKDVVGSNDMIGSCQVAEVRDLAQCAWLRLQQHRNHGEDVKAMDIEELRTEVGAMWTQQLVKAKKLLAKTRTLAQRGK